MTKLRVEKSLGQIAGGLKALIESIAYQDPILYENPMSNSYSCSRMDVIPRVPMCFDSGLTVLRLSSS